MDGFAEFEGSGWAVPIVPTSGGGLTYIAGDDNVVQSLRLLVETTVGERVMRPELGTTLSASLFSSDASQNLHGLEQSVREAIQRWEPRVVVDRVEARRVDDPAGTVELDVAVRISRTNLPRNLVFPYYLAGTVAP